MNPIAHTSTKIESNFFKKDKNVRKVCKRCGSISHIKDCPRRESITCFKCRKT
uniref:Uncharacterized protein n=1 Tax=Lepeophtheirus salmonis TaxID=72036 RepID=A0A0K2V425_LEPSM